MSQIFHGVRIIDLTQGMAGALTTMILADYGAEVIRLEPPGGDPWWELPAYRLWNRGKKSVELDWSSEQGRDQARGLLQGADIFIESLRPGEVSRLGVGYAAMAAANPALIYFSLSAFGQTGPYKDLKLYDGIVNAKTGRMREQVGWQRGRPTYRAVNDTSYHTAMFSVQALVAALRVRQITGRGQRVETSLLAGVTAPNNDWRRFEGQDLPPDRYPNEAPKEAVMRGELVADRHESDPYTATPSQLCVECKDGRWIMHSHLQPELFRAWMSAIGLDWIWDDPRFRDAPRLVNSDDRIALNLMIFERMKQKTSLEWREIYRQNPDCAGEIMQTTQEALRHEQFAANGHSIELDDPRFGRMAQVGPFAKMSETPAVISRPAPSPGQHTAEILAAPPASPPKIAATGGRPGRPLEGLVMLELASWLAAPFSGALLADLGMRVIKVEPLSGDPYRAMITNENMIRSFQGKENVALNLKTKEGQAILHRLVERADIVMHNMRPGAPARIGADYETLRKIKPDLVYVYAGSYGSEGPDSRRAAFNPTMGAFSGNSVFQSGDGNRPKGDQSPDPIAGSGVATGIMLGLAARLLTGKGQYVETSMMNSNVYCNSDDAFDYAGKPPRRTPDKAQLGLEAAYRLYETASGWVFLAVPFDPEFQAFCKIVGREDLARDPRFAASAARYENRLALGEQLEPLFRTRSADHWEQLLTTADLGCVRADGLGHRRFLHEDPHAKAVGLMVPTQSRAFADQAPGGRYWRHAPVVRFSETPCEAGKPYLGLGEHTRQVLREFGCDAAEIARLNAANVIGLPADQDEPVPAHAS
ncbi:CoA transferase [Phenylobacterium sp. LjRoot225]|uniref:CaiB/BaiF CoA transferase family protein n=1 Tax=Phenylobacterium sp. LjRoot225 TaxID=3342285 RepID=UPI003ECC9A4C